MRKMYKHIWEIQTERLEKNLDNFVPPTRMRIRLTLNCNLKCQFCIQRTYTNEQIRLQKELSKERLSDLINEAQELGVKFIEISGNGEPLCKKDTIDILQIIKEKKMFGELTTNGTLFDKEKLQKLVNMQWDLVRFSIDGATAETNDSLRGLKGGFDSAKKNLELLNKIKQDKRSEKPEIAINFIITNKNYQEIPDVIKMLYKSGGKKLWLTPMIVQSEAAKGLILSQENNEKFREIIKTVDKLAEEYGIEANTEQFMIQSEKHQGETNKKKNPFCFMPWSDIVIGEEGQIGPCFAIYFDNLNIKNENLIKIWKGPIFSDFRKKLLEGDIPKTCKDCKQWWGPEEAKQIHNARRKD